MFLPAMMDFFKTNGLVTLFMGAGNADNTKAASAMADHVLFCWRSYDTLKNSTNNVDLGAVNSEDQPRASLMLYEDRTSPSAEQPGKNLYRIPIYKGDKLDIPRSQEDLKNGDYQLNLTDTDLAKSDKDMINKITELQGLN